MINKQKLDNFDYALPFIKSSLVINVLKIASQHCAKPEDLLFHSD